MKLLIEWNSHSEILIPGKIYILGRSSNSDIVISNEKISRSHLKIYSEKGMWKIVDLNSTHGTFELNNRIEKMDITDKGYVHLGGPSNLKLNFQLVESSQSKNSLEWKNDDNDFTKYTLKSTYVDNKEVTIQRIRLANRLKIGRNKNSHWYIDDVNVSRSHAEIVQNADGEFEIVDLHSTNGTYVNNDQIRRRLLTPGDLICIGGATRRFTLDGLELVEGVDGVTLSLRNISFSAAEKLILNDVSFDLRPSTLTAIVGPSGAGKSTLVGIINGTRKPSSGTITLGDVDLVSSRKQCMRQIGYVPQTDIIHSKLTSKQALNYGAKLRLPRDTENHERKTIVSNVLEKLELTERANLRIDKLSGGQRKRASIGLELINSPDVLILDEPTSGLDPALEAHVMQTLRSLADQGQTIAVVTHSVESLELCDNVILLATGGRIAYIGPSSTVFAALRCSTWSEVFRKLTDAKELDFDLSRRESSVPRSRINFKAQPSSSILNEVVTLSARYFKVISADTFYLSLLILIPLIMGLVSYFADSPYGFGPGRMIKEEIYANPFAKGTVLLLILGSIFIGISTSIQEIIKEEAIRVREVGVGIRIGSYISSKIVVLSSICFIQIAIFSSIVLFRRPLPSKGLIMNSSKIEILLICAALGLCSMMLGLMVSSIMTSTEQTMPSLIGLTMVLVVLSGALPLENSNIISSISKLVPSYWATNAISASVDLVQLTLTKNESEQYKWEYSQINIFKCLKYLTGFFLAYMCVTYLKLMKRVN